MFEASDIIVSLIIGLAAPLAILDSSRLIFDGLLVARGTAQDGRGRFLSWIFALAAGPALFGERVVLEARAGRMRGGQVGLSVAAVLGWAWLYGLVLIGLLKQVHG